MSLFTKIGTNLWTWKPFRSLERSHDDIVGRCTKLFWLALYTSAEAKRGLPGLWHGSVTSMADAANIQGDDARRYLDRLIENDLIEYDVDHRVLRMTMLPDCGESPTNGNAIRGWWRKFQSFPSCRVRDSHVTTLRWIIDEWSRVSGKLVSHDHTAAWNETFGRVSVPEPRRQLQKAVQLPLLMENTKLETNGRSTVVVRERDQDLDLDLRSEEGGSGGERIVTLTVLDGGFDPSDLWKALRDARPGYPQTCTPEHLAFFARAIESIPTSRRTPAGLACLREYIAQGMEGFPRPASLTAEERSRPGGELAPEVIAAPGWLSLALEHAAAWKQRVNERLELARFARQQLGYEPKDEKP